jgi:mannitol/fructose-specific phosphotransferase system IIA component (Ntr-type)
MERFDTAPGSHVRCAMLTSLFAADAVRLDLAGTTQDEVLAELVALLALDPPDAIMLQKLLKRRESLGSTGVGRGVAIPHTRSGLVDGLRLAFGRLPAGIPWAAIDNRPVYFFFLIVAPPLEISNEYLPVLGRIAQFVKEPDVPERLAGLRTQEDFVELLRSKGV